MKFIVDGMLGKLTRWLRMLGYDVEYSTKLDDKQLMAIAKKEERILLTRDLELYQRAIAKEVETFFLEGQKEEKRLAELAKRYDIRLEIDMATSRCPKCNSQIKPISKEEVEGKVESNTLANYDEYWQCPRCKQIYWQGAHWTKIRKTLDTAKLKLKTDET